MQSDGITPQDRDLLTPDMVAPVTDASIAIFNTNLAKYLAPYKTGGNSPAVTVAFRLSQILRAIQMAAKSASIPADYFEESRIWHRHAQPATVPNDDSVYCHKPEELSRLKEAAADAKNDFRDMQSIYYKSLSTTNVEYQANIFTLCNQRETMMTDAQARYLNAKSNVTNRLQDLKFLRYALEIDNLAFSHITKLFPEAYLDSLDPFINGSKSRPPRTDLPIHVILNDLPTLLQLNFRDYCKHRDLVDAIQRNRGLSNPTQRADFRGLLLTNSEHFMKPTHTVRDYLVNYLRPRLKCLTGHAEQVNPIDLVRNLVSNHFNLPRFSSIQSKYRSKVNHDAEFAATFTEDHLQKIIQEYEDEDDAYWKRQKSKPEDVDTNLIKMVEVNAAWPGKTPNPTKNERNKSRGGGPSKSSSNPVTNSSAPPRPAFEGKCHHCGGKHHINACDNKKNGKPQSKAGKAAETATAERQAAKRAAKRAAKEGDSDPPPKKPKASAAKASNTVQFDSEDGEELDADVVELLTEVSSMSVMPHVEDRLTVPVQVPIDSGAQVTTMTSKSRWMTNVKPSTQVLSFGNNTTSKVECVGDIGEIKGVVVNKDTKTLISLPKLCTDNAIPIVCTSDKMYLLKPTSVVRFKESSILMETPLVNGLYRANFNELISKVGKVGMSN